jgi:hypothetical protein
MNAHRVADFSDIMYLRELLDYAMRLLVVFADRIDEFTKHPDSATPHASPLPDPCR